jgi:hypothetical protein
MRSKGVRGLGARGPGMGVSIFTKRIIHDDYQFVKVNFKRKAGKWAVPALITLNGVIE